MTELAKMKCEACTGATPKLASADIESNLASLAPEWSVDRQVLRRQWKLRNFIVAAKIDKL